MAEPTLAERPEQWDSVGEQIGEGIINVLIKSDIAKWLTANMADIAGAVGGVAASLAAPVGIALARAIAESEDVVAPALSDMAAAAVNDMFGTNVSASAFEGGIRRGSRKAAATALGDGLLKQLTGAATELTPSNEAASRYLTVVTNMALEGWYQKWFFEFISSTIPWVNIGQIENFGSLDDKMVEALGLGRLTRRVLSPIIDTTIVEPLRWQTNKTYRPNLLSTAEVVRQVASGRWTRDKGVEELARQGWSDDRIESLFSSAAKHFSLETLDYLVAAGIIAQDEAIRSLRDQGYDDQVASKELIVRQFKRLDAIRNDIIGPAIGAFVDGRIAEGELRGLLTDALSNGQERDEYLTVARARRLLNTKQIPASDVRRGVLDKVFAVPDYRAALRREGYDENSVLMLELMLRHDLDEKGDAEQARAAAVAERAAEQATRDAERQARQAAIDAERAADRRGDEADLEAAAIRGLVPLARAEELYEQRYDAETVSILVALLDDKRQTYLEQQARAEDARQRAARRSLDVGALEQSVTVGHLTVDEFRARLIDLGFSPADADLLAATLRARLAQLEDAKAKRAAAELAARIRSIDLGRFEQLVRRGVRTMAQYAALLESLGFNAGARADILELLNIEITEDTAARQAKADAERQLRARGLNLEEYRRAVLLELVSRASYEQFLIQQQIAPDRVRLLLGELDQALALAAAARAQRAKAAAAVDTRQLPIDRVRAAARLGLVSVPTYEARLAASGYQSDDVAIERELLLLEIADVQTARATRAAAQRPADPRELTLEQLARAVKKGVRTVDDYRGRLAELNYAPAATATQVRVLELELVDAQAAAARKAQLAGDQPDRALALGALEEAVTKGFLSLDEYLARLGALGFAPDDAELLAALVLDELEAAPA